MAAVVAGDPARLTKETLSWEPVRMVTPMNIKLQLLQAYSGNTMSADSDYINIRTRELSAIDLLFEEEYGSLLMFYDVSLQASQGESIVCGRDVASGPVMRLQEALEELLVQYPCAAGVLLHRESDGRLEVQYPTCNSSRDDVQIMSTPSPIINNGYGVHFHVAHANLALSDLGDISMPHPSFDLLYPSKPEAHQIDSNGRRLPRFVMAFQITTFTCGGFSIGYTSSHAYGDGFTVATFLQNLCSMARGAGLVNPPDILPSRKAVFSARDQPPTPTLNLDKIIQTRKRTDQSSARSNGGGGPIEDQKPNQLLNYVGMATRFVFGLDTLGALKASIVKEMGGEGKFICSRNQALMAILWIAHARVRLEVHAVVGSDEMILRFPINLRSRGMISRAGKTVLGRGYVGNALVLCSVYATVGELCGSSVGEVVGKIVKAMEEMDLAESVQALVDYVELQVMKEGRVPNKVGSLRMPSIVGLPFYDTDCGWGRPAYVGRPCQAQPTHRYIILDHPAAHAWNVMAVFASPQEHACFHTSIADYTRTPLTTT